MFPADVIPLQYQTMLLADEPRMAAFESAIARVVRPGMRVLDLGAGTGVLSYFAARQGAIVTAVECESQVFQLAKTALHKVFGDAVRTVQADARHYRPDGPVDLVLCEMLHVGLLRERQVEVIDRFKQHHPGPLPIFLPSGCVQTVQPVHHNFTYAGYTVPAPVFQHPRFPQPRTIEAAAPEVFQQFAYKDQLPAYGTADLHFRASRRLEVNAVRLTTRNTLTTGVEWLMSYLVVPLPEAVPVHPGDDLRLEFSYPLGAEIDALTAGLRLTRCAAPGTAPVLARRPGSVRRPIARRSRRAYEQS